MKKSMRYLAVLLALCLIAASYAGCGIFGEEPPPPPEISEELPPELDKIHILFPQNSSASYPYTAETPNLARIAELADEWFGIELTFDCVAYSGYYAKVESMLASGEELPDIIRYDQASAQLIKAYDSGAIIDLRAMIEAEAPEIESVLLEDAALLAYHAAPDGAVLRIPDINDAAQNQVYCLNIRTDWLDTTGAEMPSTAAEFSAVLRRFRQWDVNRNGAADEVFLAYYTQLNMALAQAFGILRMSTAAESWDVDADGKVYHTMTTDAAREYFRYVNGLISEGLLLLDQPTETYRELLAEDKMSAGAGPFGDAVSNTGAALEANENARYLPMDPLHQADGTQQVLIRDRVTSAGFVVTKDCEVPVAAIQLLDWAYSTEGTQQIFYGGPENENEYFYQPTWPEASGMEVADYLMEYSEKGMEEVGKEPELWAKMGWSAGILPRNIRGTIDNFNYDCIVRHGGADRLGLAGDAEFNRDYFDILIAECGVPEVIFWSASAEQYKQAEKFSQLYEYIDMAIMEFMQGFRLFDEWDEFVAECGEMGLDSAAEFMQARYDTGKLFP